MQEIIDFIFFENDQLENFQDSGLSNIGVYTDKDGFFKYEAGYLKLNSSSPEKQAIKILDNLNYISEIPTFECPISYFEFLCTDQSPSLNTDCKFITKGNSLESILKNQ